MKESQKYATFWKEFGRTIKLGVIEDAPNRPRLAKLLRVHTSAVSHPAHLVSKWGMLLDGGCREQVESPNDGGAQRLCAGLVQLCNTRQCAFNTSAMGRAPVLLC